MEFLKKTADYLLKNHPEDFGSITVVLPNRRAGIFLKKYLSELIHKPVFLPKIVSIQDFVLGLSAMNMADEITLLVELYKSYAAVKPSEPETFDEFLHWGGKLLQDFDELDQHLAETEFVFSYLKEDKNLALWALDKKPLSEFQKNYLEFYGLLHDIYLDFTARLYERGTGTYGMACRRVAGLLKTSDDVVNSHPAVVFAGINALSASEEFIINCFYQNAKAELLWDGDEYYVKDTLQEAGSFIRRYLSQWDREESKWIDNELLTQPKKITLVAVAGKVGQVKYAAREIASLLAHGVKSEQISVVLNEESLLIPMLNSVPQDIEKFNITMGYPMRFSSVYNFIESVFLLHENAERFRNIKNAKEPLFYHKDLQKLFNHNFVSNIDGGGHLLVSMLKGQERIFYTRDEVNHLLSKCFQTVPGPLAKLFEPWYQQASKAVECLTGFITFIKEEIFSKRGLDAEFLFAAIKIFSRITAVSETAGLTLPANTLHQLFSQYVSQTRVPFVGEPLNGLQIMGMLETRTLDFDTVFLLSVNEGVLPKAKSGTSFIPHGIRVDANLPTYKQNEEIFAYHFYRILQRSKNIYLIYNTQPDDMGGGERSRFVNQVVHELPKKNPLVTIDELFVTFPPEKNSIQPMAIKKDQAVVERLAALAKKGLSPSALNVYRKCGLQYYYSYVAGIWEAEELSETIDSKELGDHIHEVLDSLFKPYENAVLTEDVVSGFLDYYEAILEKVYYSDKPGTYDRKSGKNLLIYNVIRDYLRKFIVTQLEIVREHQKEKILHKVLSTEKDLRHSLELGDDSMVKTLLLKGVADRIDLIGNNLQIIDYKSGNTGGKNFDIYKLLADEQDYRNDYCFQVLLYLWLYNKQHPGERHEGQYCGVWSMRRIEEGISNVCYDEFPEKSRSPKLYAMQAEHLEAFEQMLMNILKSLFNRDEDFVQTGNEENCELCPYALICGR
ncbi:MAG TPA: PD-(D/E)XK nuclease family protein [Bacteroidales bacterium]|nr:PD-(D/E)XK nuclease family protein [Bacteroidales bacterium]